MKARADDHRWFTEPTVADASYARRGEGSFAWLGRSTIERAVECRRFLNDNLAQLPAGYAVSVHDRLRHSWRSAFFELFVGRVLQLLGAELEVEAAGVDGRRPDFRARFGTGSVTVEATAPVFQGGLQKEMVSRDKLLDIIESEVPEPWSVLPHGLPQLGPADPKGEFRRVLRELLRLPVAVGVEPRRLRATTSRGDIDLTVLPRMGRRAIVSSGVFTYSGDGVEKIRRAVGRKRRQVRGSDLPVILAINVSELDSDMDCFDRALLGHQREFIDGEGKSIGVEFVQDGVLAPNGEGLPIVAGVLAFVEVGFRCCNEPVFYLHPRFKGDLPGELKEVEWRTAVASAGISCRPARRRVLQGLGPVTV